MNVYKKLLSRESKLALVGLGYVGMPIAVAFSKKIDVIGFDINEKKVEMYLDGIDPTKEVGDEAIKNCTVKFTNEESKLKEASFFIVAVPTPVNLDNTPDLSPVIGASELVGRNLSKGSIVVYESTVYPGVTEDVCIDILERESGLKCGIDFKIGYSPERINPGDKIHTLENITKIVSGMDEETLEEIAKVYELVIEAGVHKAASIKVAEAAKVVENSQRDINIAFMNELAIIFDKMGIDTNEVIEAMNTKWNALHFYPGLVGGHCIGVDPYYLIYEAGKFGYHSKIVLPGRQINDYMGEFVTEAIIKELILANKVVKQAKIAIMGVTFKGNCPDIRNSKVIDIVNQLRSYNIEPVICDPEADPKEVEREYGITLTPMEEIKNLDCIVFTVAHDKFKDINIDNIDSMFKIGDNSEKIIIDVKAQFDKKQIEDAGFRLWRL